MGSPRLCVDIDNVIAQTDEVMRDVIREVTGGRVNLRYEDIREFDYHRCTDRDGNSIDRETWRDVHDRFSDSDRISSIKPVSGIQQRLRLVSEKYFVHFATARLMKARAATVEWLAAVGFDFQYDLHFISHGEKHTTLGAFPVAVEDDLVQALAFTDKAAASFLLAHPWNQVTDPPSNLHRVESWESLTKALLDLAL